MKFVCLFVCFFKGLIFSLEYELMGAGCHEYPKVSRQYFSDFTLLLDDQMLGSTPFQKLKYYGNLYPLGRVAPRGVLNFLFSSVFTVGPTPTLCIAHLLLRAQNINQIIKHSYENIKISEICRVGLCAVRFWVCGISHAHDCALWIEPGAAPGEIVRGGEGTSGARGGGYSSMI